MPRLSSRDTVAWGFEARRGLQGVLSSLLGLFSKASCGLTRFWVRNAFPKGPCFLDFEADYQE